MSALSSSGNDVARAFFHGGLVVLVLNGLFVLVLVAALGGSTTVRLRIRAAFDAGDLGVKDFLPFDSRRGVLQYNDCNVLQMLVNDNPSRAARAISPIIYSANEDWTHQCAVLHQLMRNDATVAELIPHRYSRYWHGYSAGVAIALRAMEIRTLRRVLVSAVWLSLAALAVVMLRAGYASGVVGLAVTFTAALFWAVPYFDPGFTLGFGDAALLIGLIVLAARPSLSSSLNTLVPYAAGFGAVVVFFEMLTGQLPVAAALLIACVVAARRDHSTGGQSHGAMPALAALVAFALGALATVAAKQVLAMSVFDRSAGDAFVSHLRLYMDVPAGAGSRPGILLPFVKLWDNLDVLTYHNRRAGHALVAFTAVAWMLTAVRIWRGRSLVSNQERAVLLAASLLPVAWVLVLPQHTLMHAGFMVRILVASVALTLVAVSWPS